MSLSPVAQVLLSTLTALAAVWLTAWFSGRQVTRARRDDLQASHLTGLARDLAGVGRELREILTAGDACSGCGTGISPRRLHEIADRTDQLVDLALLHVRDRELSDRLQSVFEAVNEVQRHRKSDRQPCNELLHAASRLAFVCDQRAAECLNVVFKGRPVVPPREPRRGLVGWVLTAPIELVDAIIESRLRRRAAR